MVLLRAPITPVLLLSVPANKAVTALASAVTAALSLFESNESVPSRCRLSPTEPSVLYLPLPVMVCSAVLRRLVMPRRVESLASSELPALVALPRGSIDLGQHGVVRRDH